MYKHTAALAAVLLTACSATVDTFEVHPDDADKQVTCTDTLAGRSISFNTNNITNIHVREGGYLTFTVNTPHGAKLSLNTEHLRCGEHYE